MPKIFVGLSLCLASTVLVMSGCVSQVDKGTQQTVDIVTGLNAVPQGEAAKKDLAVAQCQALFQRRFAAGDDLSAGPCLADQVIADWSCDLVHEPRISADDQEVNQCAAYLRGETHHYVELDQAGQLFNTK